MIWLRALAAIAFFELIRAGLLTLAVRDVRRLSLPERLGFSFGLGLVAWTTVLFLLSLCGRTPVWWTGAACLAVLAFAVVVFRRGSVAGWVQRFAGRDEGAWTAAPFVLAGFIACLLLVHAAVSLLEPIAEWDVIAIWALKAKVVLREPVMASAYFHDPTKAYSHLDYPLLWPFAMAWVWACCGSADAQVVKLLAPALMLALVGSLYGLARRRCSRSTAMLYAALLAGIPIVLSQTSRLLADAPLAFLALLAFGTASAWLEDGDVGLLRLSGIFSAGLVLTKNEGIGLAVILAIALLARRTRLREVALWSCALPAALASPWLVFRAGIPKLAEDYGARIDPAIVIANLGRAPEIARGLARYALDVDDWLLFWPFAALVLALGARRLARPPLAFLATSIALVVCMYGAIYVITPWDVTVLMETTAARLLLHVAPLTILLLAGMSPRS